MAGPLLLIDGRNCAYRAIHGNQRRGQRHSFVPLLHFMNDWLERFRPAEVHLFWDAPRVSLWRRRYLSTYKDRSGDSQYRPDVKEELAAVQDVCQVVLAHMNVRQYLLDQMEADDLIYAACRLRRDAEVVVISNDGDFVQIPYRMSHVKVFDPLNGRIMDVPDFDPVVRKALMGDNSDKVPGYAGIGPVKSEAMARDRRAMLAFLDSVGLDPYLRNMLLIDLAMSPYVVATELYVLRRMQAPLSYDRAAVFKAAEVHKVAGLYDEYTRVAVNFKRLGQTEGDSNGVPGACGADRVPDG